MARSHSWSRRDFLRAGGTAFSCGLAGCQSIVGRQQTTSTTTTAGSSKSCGPGKERVALYETADVSYGELDGMTLAARPESVQVGDELTVTLANETNEDRMTGNRSKYLIHRLDGGEWRSIFGKDEDETIVYTDEGIIHGSGEGFTWELTITQDDLAYSPQNERERLTVCNPISPGTYRFLYFGWSRLAAQFTVTDS